MSCASMLSAVRRSTGTPPTAACEASAQVLGDVLMEPCKADRDSAVTECCHMTAAVPGGCCCVGWNSIGTQGQHSDRGLRRSAVL